SEAHLKLFQHAICPGKSETKFKESIKLTVQNWSLELLSFVGPAALPVLLGLLTHLLLQHLDSCFPWLLASPTTQQAVKVIPILVAVLSQKFLNFELKPLTPPKFSDPQPQSAAHSLASCDRPPASACESADVNDSTIRRTRLDFPSIHPNSNILDRPAQPNLLNPALQPTESPNGSCSSDRPLLQVTQILTLPPGFLEQLARAAARGEGRAEGEAAELIADANVPAANDPGNPTASQQQQQQQQQQPQQQPVTVNAGTPPGTPPSPGSHGGPSGGSGSGSGDGAMTCKYDYPMLGQQLRVKHELSISLNANTECQIFQAMPARRCHGNQPTQQRRRAAAELRRGAAPLEQLRGGRRGCLCQTAAPRPPEPLGQPLDGGAAAAAAGCRLWRRLPWTRQQRDVGADDTRRRQRRRRRIEQRQRQRYRRHGGQPLLQAANAAAAVPSAATARVRGDARRLQLRPRRLRRRQRFVGEDFGAGGGGDCRRPVAPMAEPWEVTAGLENCSLKADWLSGKTAANGAEARFDEAADLMKLQMGSGRRQPSHGRKSSRCRSRRSRLPSQIRQQVQRVAAGTLLAHRRLLEAAASLVEDPGSVSGSGLQGPSTQPQLPVGLAASSTILGTVISVGVRFGHRVAAAVDVIDNGDGGGLSWGGQQQDGQQAEAALHPDRRQAADGRSSATPAAVGGAQQQPAPDGPQRAGEQKLQREEAERQLRSAVPSRPASPATSAATSSRWRANRNFEAVNDLTVALRLQRCQKTAIWDWPGSGATADIESTRPSPSLSLSPSPRPRPSPSPSPSPSPRPRPSPSSSLAAALQLLQEGGVGGGAPPEQPHSRRVDVQRHRLLRLLLRRRRLLLRLLRPLSRWPRLRRSHGDSCRLARAQDGIGVRPHGLKILGGVVLLAVQHAVGAAAQHGEVALDLVCALLADLQRRMHQRVLVQDGRGVVPGPVQQLQAAEVLRQIRHLVEAEPDAAELHLGDVAYLIRQAPQLVAEHHQRLQVGEPTDCLRHLLQHVIGDVEKLQLGAAQHSGREVHELVVGQVDALQLGEVADLRWQAAQPVVAERQALEVLQQADLAGHLGEVVRVQQKDAEASRSGLMSSTSSSDRLNSSGGTAVKFLPWIFSFFMPWNSGSSVSIIILRLLLPGAMEGARPRPPRKEVAINSVPSEALSTAALSSQPSRAGSIRGGGVKFNKVLSLASIPAQRLQLNYTNSNSRVALLATAVRRAAARRVAAALFLLLLLLLLLLLAAAALPLAGHLLVGHFEQLQAGLLQLVGGSLDAGRGLLVFVRQPIAQAVDELLELVVLLLRQLAAELLHLGLGVVDDALGLVHHLYGLAALLVGRGVLLGVAHHVLDLVLAEPAAGLDDDLLLPAGALVPGRHVHDAVSVDVENHLGGSGVQTQFVVGGHLPLALVHLDLDLGLAVSGGGEHLRLLGRDGGVAADQAGEDAAEGLDAQRQGRHVQQQDVGHVASENAALQRR
uniref:Protein kinase domain-containing protein n=1 Tax=Macrostomum lignano TaxID=282301 RepID=A0A1I8ISP5_9PLAT